MLENPFNFNSLYESHELFGLELGQPDVDVKTMIFKQSMQEHQGIIITQKDLVHIGTTHFKSVELNNKFLSISVKND
jgi:hypothetical protein